MNEGTKCTWEGCGGFGEFIRKGRDGSQWAILCRFHEDKMNDIIASGDVKKLLGSWVKAQGGAKAAAKRMG